VVYFTYRGNQLYQSTLWGDTHESPVASPNVRRLPSVVSHVYMAWSTHRLSGDRLAGVHQGSFPRGLV